MTRDTRERDLELGGRESTRRKKKKKKLRREEEKEEGDEEEEEEEEEEEKEVLCKSDGHIAKFHAAWFEDRFNG